MESEDIVPLMSVCVCVNCNFIYFELLTHPICLCLVMIV